MGSEHATGKIDYQKPEVLDLGEVAPYLGGLNCNPGGTATSSCTGGGAATVLCTVGSARGGGGFVLPGPSTP